MKPTLNEKLIAYLTLFSGLSISAVAVYYSVAGLTAIFSAAFIPIIVMGVCLEVSKLIATVWLKQNWLIAPKTIKLYLIIAISVLMLITSMGIFGFLSKAHNDQSLISGDVQSKLAVYDEKIKTAKENIEADRKQLKQMDEAVDQVMARSTTEEGAARSNAIRKAQARDRNTLAKNIEANQKLIAALNDEAAPIRAEIRKVEAEVGPLKYIAQFIYGETDKNLLEKAVTWVIIIIVFVFDPLAVILLLSSQLSFQNFKEREEKLLEVKKENEDKPDEQESVSFPTLKLSEDEPNNKDEFIQKQIGDLWDAMDQPCSKCGSTMVYKPDVGITCPNTECAEEKNSSDVHRPETHPYLSQGFKYPSNFEFEKPQVFTPDVIDQRLALNEILKLEEKENLEVQPEIDTTSSLYVQNEEQQESNLWTSATVTTSLVENTDIGSSEYVKASIVRRNQLVNEYSQQVREGRISMTEVPEDLLPLVKARV